MSRHQSVDKAKFGQNQDFSKIPTFWGSPLFANGQSYRGGWRSHIPPKFHYLEDMQWHGLNTARITVSSFTIACLGIKADCLLVVVLIMTSREGTLENDNIIFLLL